MKKSTVIATCLVNSSMTNRLEDAESAVRQVFIREFPDASLVEWDREIDDHQARQIIGAVGRASRIDVRKFIEDLW